TTITASAGAVSGSTTLTVAAAPALVSIAVTPSNPSVAAGLTRQFAANGTYSDNSVRDVSGSVTWTSSALGVATISNGGLATSSSQGSTIISASLGSITGSTTLTVTAPALVSIAVTPANPSLYLNLSLQFTATGTYTNGSTQNLT